MTVNPRLDMKARTCSAALILSWANLQAARDYAVITSGLVASEIEDVHDFQVFERLFEDLEGKDKSRLQKALNPRNALSGYREWANLTSNHREAILRYAAFLHFKERLQAGDLTNFAASDRGVAKTLVDTMGVDAAAAHMSRDLLGDYGDVSQYGQALRTRIVPFWAFQEINLRRFPTMIANSIAAGDWKGAARSVGVKSVSVPLKVALAVSRNAWMFGAAWLFNHIMFPDDEAIARGKLLAGDEKYQHAYDGFRAFLRSLDPVENKLNPVREQRFVEEYLNPTDLAKLDIARAWARDQELRGWTWWQQASEEGDSPDQRKANKRAVAKERHSMAAQATHSMPARKPGETAEEHSAMRAEIKDKRIRAREDLKLKTLRKRDYGILSGGY
ncbi:MAG: hypothetical protein NTY19_22580 [Planctomycetota bacterium]|nr:hypothetical protein [Planctomycetota bacterium]